MVVTASDPDPDGRRGAPGAMSRLTLEWLCDDPADCEEVTVFDPVAEDPTTAWISVDAEAAVALYEAR